MMQRKVLEAVAKRKGWSTGWSALMKTSSLSDVDLNDSSGDEESASTDAAAPSSPDAVSDRLLTPALAYPLVSVEAFRSAYEVSNARVNSYTPLTLNTAFEQSSFVPLHHRKSCQVC